MASTHVQTFPGKVGIANVNPIHTLDIGSNVYIDDTGINKLTVFGNIHASGMTVDGTVTVIDTDNLNVKDPIILLASESTGTTDTGIIMKRADGDSNVAVFYDEGVGLTLAHTLSSASDIHIAVDTNSPLPTRIHGPLTVVNATNQSLSVQGGAEISGNLAVGTLNLLVDGTTGNVGIGTTVPGYTLDVVGEANVGALTVTSIAGDGSALSGIQSSNVSDFASNVVRIENLETSNVSIWSNLASNVVRIASLESEDMTIDGEKTFSSNLEVGTANLFVDTTTGFVGVGTTNPEYTLDVVGDVAVSSNLAVSGSKFTYDNTNTIVFTGTNASVVASEIGYLDMSTSSTSNNIRVKIFIQYTQSGAQGEAEYSYYIRPNSANSSSIYDYINKGGPITPVVYRTDADDLYSGGTPGVVRFGYSIITAQFVNWRVEVTQRSNNVTFYPTNTGLAVDGTGLIQVTPAPSTNLNSNLAVNTDTLFVDTTTGNVGIGTDDPDYTLDVVGDINLTSNIVMSGEVFVKAHDATKNYVAVGRQAGQTSQGDSAVAVGYLAGQTSQHDNSIVLNASGSALDTVGTGRTYIKPLRVATVASNVMTYDQTTGEVMDSGGLLANRLAVVSEQPPSALTGDTTTIQGHGKYVVEVSSTANSANAKHQAFDKNSTGSAWLSAANYDANGDHTNSAVTLNSIQGEYIKLTLPYKTTLRHFTLACRNSANSTLQFPTDFTLLASNDGSSWTSLYSLSGGDTPSLAQVSTYIVNAASSYKTYAIVVEKISPNSEPSLQGGFSEWRLFTESFSVDGGIVTTTAASGLETGFTEHPVAPMTDYNTYVEGHGTYEASASNFGSGFEPWEAYTKDNVGRGWLTTSNRYYSDGTYASSVVTTDVGGTRYSGDWNQIKFPYATIISSIDFYGYWSDLPRAPTKGIILGSNDGENWYKLTEFSGKTYTYGVATIIDVNATSPYSYFRIVVTDVGTNALGGRCELSEIYYFSATGVTKMDNVLISGELAVDGGALQTSHIKWPKVPLKANESEGYVASASSLFSTTNFYPYYAFNDLMYDAFSYVSETGSFSNYLPVTSRTTGNDTFNHEWLQIQLPQAITLSYFLLSTRIHGTYGNEKPKAGRLYASNDGITWDKITTFDNLTYTATGTNSRIQVKVDVKSTQAYKYYRLAVTEILHESGSASWVYIEELQLFESTLGVGTSATTAKLTVDGGLGLAKGSQVFAGSDVVTEFPKHDRPLTKYPEATSGTVVTNSTDTQPGTAFNLNYSDIGWHPTANYTSDTGVADGSTTTIDMKGIEYDGEWTQVLLPVAVKVKYLDVYYRYSSKRQTRDGTVLGSNDGTNWTHLQSWDDLSLTESTSIPHHLEVNSTKYFNYIRYIVERVAGETLPNIREIEIWGTEEGDESVDIVHRSIPNKPSQQQLAVYYEARDPNSYSFADSTKVYDLSGNGRTGTLTGGVGFDAEYNAFTFDGVDDYISGTLSNPAGDWVHSISLWFKADSFTAGADSHTLFCTGSTSANNGLFLRVNGERIAYNDLGAIAEKYTSINTGVWYHVTATYSGGGWSNAKLYINGILAATGTTDTTPLTLTASSSFFVAKAINSSNPSFNGQIANFRLFGKVLNADQVRELYEYDAERFGHRQNLVALHKGNLGVGVTNPTSRFEVAGADGLQEYPPRGITQPGTSYVGYRLEEYIEGHGQYVIDGSSSYNSGGDDRRTWALFDKGLKLFHGASYFTTGTPAAIDEATTTAGNNENINFNTKLSSGATIFADWAQIELPHKILLKRNIVRNHNLLTRSAAKGYIVASNDGLTFDVLNTIDDFGYTTTYQDKVFETTTNTYYRIFRILFTHKVGGDANGAMNMGEWRLFGTPAPSALEDGHLTLGKALTLPRVSGHPAGAETPRVESLVVHYDTTVDSVVAGSTVVDISGTGNNGTLTGAAYSSTDRALTFDGVNDYVSGTLNNPAGEYNFTASMWLNQKARTSTTSPFLLGNDVNGTGIGIDISTTIINTFVVGETAYTYPTSLIPLNTWIHLVLYRTSGVMGMYINGIYITPTSSGSGSVNLPINAQFTIGSRGTTNYLNSSISNFKLYNVALTAEEVAQEYALGRTGKSINLTDTALCLGGTVPRAQLDVRGSARVGTMNVDGNVGIGTASPISRLDVSDLSGSKTTPVLTLNYDGALRYSSPAPSVWQAVDFTTEFGGIRTRQCGINLLNYGAGGTGQFGITSRMRTGLGFSVHNESGIVENALVINKDGNVGIGYTNPTCPLDFGNLIQNRIISFYGGSTSSSSSSTNYYGFGINSGTLRYNVYGTNDVHKFYGDSTEYGYINNAAGFQNSFTGQHKSFPHESLFGKTSEDLCGLIVTASGEHVSINDKVPEKGQKAISVSEAIPSVKLSVSEKDKKVFGVVSDVEDVETSERYDHYGAFVSTFEKEPGDSRIYVNSIGEGAIWVVNTNGAFENGDYITTSNVAGYGMKQDSEFLANYTVAKITMDCDFNPPTQPKQQIVKELTNVNYYKNTSNTSINENKYNQLNAEQKEEYTLEVREELTNVLDEYGQLQWEDTEETEKAYKIRYLTADGKETDEANAVHIAAFVGCTYHCG
jgi:hypothetical protein